MMSEHLQDVAAAFSRKAQTYDAFGAGHENLTRMRRAYLEEVLFNHLQFSLHLLATGKLDLSGAPAEPALFRAYSLSRKEPPPPVSVRA